MPIVPDFIRRFEAEARTVARLEHPYILPLYDFWREADGAFLVMRYMRGGSLTDALANSGAWSIERMLRLVDQIGSGLAASHQQGVVHHDLKPANILCDEDGNSFLADFGIARHILDVPQSTTPQLTTSPYYTSPEQLRGEPTTPQSDIYTFGYLLFELLTGQKSWPSASIGTLIQRHLQTPMPIPSTINPELNEAIDGVLQKATAKVASDRFASVPIFVTAVREALVGDGTAIGIPQPLPTAMIDGNPYKGLRAFQEGDAELFFGRTELIKQLIDQLQSSRFLAIVGPSGSGKSSVVKAGLVPKLRKPALSLTKGGEVARSEEWFIVEMVPSSHPFEELEAALLRVAIEPPDGLIEPLQKDVRGLTRTLKRIMPPAEANNGEPGQLLLVIDQFEELFTLVEDEAQRQLFIDSLLAALNEPRSQLRIVLTLRADFYDRPLQLPELAKLMEANTVVVRPLDSAELNQVITRPAALAGVRFEDGLVPRIIDDVRDQPGMLPLLQYALTELFERVEGGVISAEAYSDMGGVSGVLGQRAEAIYTSLTPNDQALAKQLFLRLVTLGEGVEDTRRRVLQSELEALAEDSKQLSVNSEQSTVNDSSQFAVHNLPFTILSSFGNARLLSFDRDPATRTPTVEVAHEALLREWPRLREWLRESRDDLRLQRRLGVLSAEYAQSNQDPSFLLRGSQLNQFESWTDQTTIVLTADEQRFLNASIEAREHREAEKETRRQRDLKQAQLLAETERQRAEEQSAAAGRLRQTAMLLAGALAIAGVLAVAAFVFGRSATNNANLAATRETEAVVAKATAETEAEIRGTAEAVAVLERENAEEQTRLTRSRELALATINNLDQDAELSILLALEALNTAYTRETEEALHQAVSASRTLLRLTGHGWPMSEIVYSPDGTKLAATSWRDTNTETSIAGTVYVWDTETGERIFSLDNVGTVGNRIAFNQDGSAIAVAYEDWPNAGQVKLFDAETGELLRLLEVFPQDMRSDQELTFFNIGVWSVDFSPDGRQLATAQFDMETLSATVWDLESGTALYSLSNVGSMDDGIPQWQDGPNFSPSGKYLAGGSTFGEATLWDAATGNVIISVTHTIIVGERVYETAFVNNDKLWLTKASTDDLIKVWDTASGELVREIETGSHIGGMDVNGDGSLLAIGREDGTVLILDTGSWREHLVVAAGATDIIGDVAFSPDGRRLAGKGENGGVFVWDITPEKEVITLNQASEGGAASLAYSPAGTLVASGDFVGTIRVWDVNTGQQMQKIDAHSEWIIHVAFNPSGTHLASSSGDGTAKVWDVTSGSLLQTLEQDAKQASQLVFSPDGKRIATSADTNVRIWDSASGELLQTISGKEDVFALGIAFNSDGTQIAASYTEHWDNRLIFIGIYDVMTGQEIRKMESAAQRMINVYFSSQDDFVVSGSFVTGEIYVWDSHDGRELQRIDTGINIRSLRLLSDDRRVVLGTTDGTVEIWDLESGQRLRTVLVNENNRQIIAVSPDERYVASVGFLDGLVRVVTLDIAELRALAEARLTRTFTTAECVRYRIEPCPTSE